MWCADRYIPALLPRLQHLLETFSFLKKSRKMLRYQKKWSREIKIIIKVAHPLSASMMKKQPSVTARVFNRLSVWLRTSRDCRSLVRASVSPRVGERTRQRNTANAERRHRPTLRSGLWRRWAPSAARRTCSRSLLQSWWPGRWLAWRS